MPSRFDLLATLIAVALLQDTSAFLSPSMTKSIPSRDMILEARSSDLASEGESCTRRRLLQVASGIVMTNFIVPLSPAVADGKSFAPGGTLVEYEVGVTVGNPEASKSRKQDNSNVVFNQDYYFKFGTAAQWIPNGSTEFPKTMPFTSSQQRYDTMKKYRERVQRGINLIAGLGDAVRDGSWASIADGSAPEYSIRPMGLMANGFLASENTGTTNELLLARWYINEIELDITDIKNAPSKEAALLSYQALINALNSYLGLLNRVITPKVGDKWDLV